MHLGVLVSTFIPFADSMGINSKNLPADPKFFPMIALYATGTDGIEATAAEIARFTAAGVGVVLIDQTESLSVFAAGLAHVAIADVEPGAATPPSVTAAVLARGKRGQESTIYTDGSELVTVKHDLQSAGADMALVSYGLADWSLSQAEAEARIVADPTLAYVQWASPSSNPLTPVPGTGEPLSFANVDLDIANLSWAARFLPKPPTVGPFWHSLGSETIAKFAMGRGANPVNMLVRSAAGWSAAQRAEIITKAENMIVSTVNP
jgi:hypothetical protein